MTKPTKILVYAIIIIHSWPNLSFCMSFQDYQEELTTAQEDKQQLQQMGERLVRASHKSKASAIEHKLVKVSDRWQHLLDLIGAR